MRRVNVCGRPATAFRAGQSAVTVCGPGSGSFVTHFPAVRTGSTANHLMRRRIESRGKRRIKQIRRRVVGVLVVAVLAVLAAALPSLIPHPTHVGKSAFVLSSTRRPPVFDLPRHPFSCSSESASASPIATNARWRPGVKSSVGTNMAERRALSVSTETGGGIATHVRVMQQTLLWTDWNIRHVLTHRDGSAAAKIGAVRAWRAVRRRVNPVPSQRGPIARR